MDPSDARVSGAGVTVVSDETGRRRTVQTDSTGEFSFTALPPGTYRVEAERDGFRQITQAVTLNVNQELRVELRL